MSKDTVKAQDVQESLGKIKIGEAVPFVDFIKAVKKVDISVKKLNKDVEALWRLSKKVREDEFEGSEFRDFIKDINASEFRDFIKDINALVESIGNNAKDPLASVGATLKDKLPRF